MDIHVVHSSQERECHGIRGASSDVFDHDGGVPGLLVDWEHDPFGNWWGRVVTFTDGTAIESLYAARLLRPAGPSTRDAPSSRTALVPPGPKAFASRRDPAGSRSVTRGQRQGCCAIQGGSRR